MALQKHCHQEDIPGDAVIYFKFEQQTLPPDVVYSLAIPVYVSIAVYVSEVLNPSMLYIQMREMMRKFKDSVELPMASFYIGNKSKFYIMKNAHIKVGSSCVVLSPMDHIWYRAKIVKIVSMKTVEVYFVDYGTYKIIPKALLRYIKKEYTKFPAQAIKAKIGYLKPPQNKKWDYHIRNRIREMVDDKRLRALIHHVAEDGILTISLTDTYGRDDIHISSVLCSEGLAEYDEMDSDNTSASMKPSPVTLLLSSPVMLPFAVVSPDFKFKVQSLPPNYEFGTFVPTYIGSIATPGHLYIQLQEETISNEFSQLGSDIDIFYNGDYSKRYAMKNAHIKVGAACVAQWPSNEVWYRAEISSIPSMESVEVLYVDYGMKDIIPISLLKYLRKAYAKLPAQAIRSRLAYIKPSRNAAKWNLKANQRLLELTADVFLMVKIEEVTQDGIFSIVLCDTNGPKDVYINDVLCNEEIAEWIDGNPNHSISAESPVSSSLPKAIPLDVVSPDFKFKVQSLPPNYEFGTFVPTYIGSIATPGHLYIQLQEETISNEFSQLGSDIDIFYNGDYSKRYAMKNAHIKVGAACVAQWPSNEVWYRAEISSIPSMESVEVLYVDYGMKDIIPISLLKYLRKAYAKLPAQAIRSRLAYIKPSKNAAKWNLKANQRLLELTADIFLMVKIEEVTQDGIFSIVLCDTNGPKDVYINDVLCNEEIAEWIDGNPNNSISAESPVSSSLPKGAQIEYCSSDLLRARYFLQAFAAAAPPFAQNEDYLTLLKQVSMYCPNSVPTLQNSTQMSSLEKDCEREVYEMFRKFAQMKNVRFVQRILLNDGYKIHIIVVESQPFVSSGDISKLIWNNREADYLLRRLQQEAEDFSPLNLSEDDNNQELFRQLEKCNVKGVQKTTDFKSSVLLYPIRVVIKILNLFGHPSLRLRVNLSLEIRKFDVDDSIWQAFSDPEIHPEEDNNVVTDNHEFERLCLSDLLAIKDGIQHRIKINQLNDSGNDKYANEINRLKQMHLKILKRIEKIKKMCKMFK